MFVPTPLLANPNSCEILSPSCIGHLPTRSAPLVIMLSSRPQMQEENELCMTWLRILIGWKLHSTFCWVSPILTFLQIPAEK